MQQQAATAVNVSIAGHRPPSPRTGGI